MLWISVRLAWLQGSGVLVALLCILMAWVAVGMWGVLALPLTGMLFIIWL